MVEVLRNHAAWFDQLIYGKRRFVRTHRKKIAAMDDGEIHTVETRLRRPVADEPRVAGPEHRKTVSEANDVTGFAAGIAC